MKTLLSRIFVVVVLLYSHDIFAQDLSNYPISLQPLDAINTNDNDYAPVLSPSRDQLFFSSSRSGGRGSTDIYYSQRSISGAGAAVTIRTDSRNASADADTRTKTTNSWGMSQNMQSFNSSNYEGALSFSGDGTHVVFAAERSEGFGDADIYIGDFIEGGIRNVQNLGSGVNTEEWESQPSISKDGNTVYFSSNRKGGVGGTDIWMTSRGADGKWSTAQCLDRTINTSKDERSPFISSDGGTLVFASNGHAGFGGFDLFYSSRELNGAMPDWSFPTNLGGIVNSDNDELFYYSAAAGDYFYLSSSRNKDRGLDIYQGTPNLLGTGTVRYYLSVVDSVTNNPLPATVTIIDVAANIPVTTIMTSSDKTESLVTLPANRAYRIETRVQGFPVRTTEVQPVSANSTQHIRVMFGAVGFDFSNYQIPFFVTGYYRPNTSSNLEKLFDLREGDLNDANYIEHFDRNSEQHQRYVGYAKVVDDLFMHVTSTAVDTVLPRFRKNAAPNEILEITVYGYADPKPILGRYEESETIHYYDANGTDHTIEQHDKLSNLSLSGLRAVHSQRELQRSFEDYSAQRGLNDFSTLLKEGRVRFRCVAGGVNTSGTDFAAQRRIKIDFRPVGSGTSNPEFDSNSLKK